MKDPLDMLSVNAWRLGCVIAPLFFLGCVALDVPEFDRRAPIKGKPDSWATPGNHRISGESVLGWVNDFESPILVKLANEAVGNNFTIAAALQRVFQAEERARISRSALFPQIETDLDSSRQQTATQPGFNRSTRHSFSVDTSWEVDLWGRLKDLKNAELAVMDAEFHAYQSARLSLVATVMASAFELAESEEQILSLEKNLASLETNLEILDAQLVAGDADERTALEIALSRADISRQKAALVAEKRDRDQSRRILEALLGRYPAGTITALTELPDPKRSIPIGLPSDLLIRRPDILQAEMSVNSALFDVSAAQKQLLPSFRLTSGIGTSTSDVFKDLFNLNNLVWNIAQGLTQPVFQGGRIQSEIKLSESQRDELISDYAQTVLTAFQEIEIALASEEYFDKQVEALQENVEEANLAEELSLADYEKGIVDIITLLESQRRSFDAESDLLSTRLQRLLNRIDLYLALGGDFDTKPKRISAPPIEKKSLLQRYRAEKRPGKR